MVKDLRSDPIYKKSQSFFKAKEPFKKDLLLKYKETVDQTIAFRLWVMLPIGVILHLTFSFFDFYFYPSQAPLFLGIRILDSFLITLATIPVFFKSLKKYCVWSCDLSIILLSGAIIYMIYRTDGASSNYFAGVNLTLLANLLINSFYFWHCLFTCLVVVILYTLGVLRSPMGWDAMRFSSGIYFVSSTAFFVVLMAKFYSTQHFNAFVRNEELKEDERKLEILYGMAEEKSKIDDLTKIYNRGYFFEILAAKINACKTANSFFYLIIFDIDHFKEINDTYGHVFGDQVIAAVAKTVQNVMRLNSYIGRYGGDEFMLIIDKATQEEFLFRLQRIRQAIRSVELVCDGKPVSISASFGAARWEPDMMDEKKLIELADGALLEVKRTQRGEIKLAE